MKLKRKRKFNHRFSVFMVPDMIQGLHTESKNLGVSAGSIIRSLVSDFLEDQKNNRTDPDFLDRLTTTKQKETIGFRIKNPITNLYSCGSMYPVFRKQGKIWKNLNSLSQHMHLTMVYPFQGNRQLYFEDYCHPYLDCVVERITDDGIELDHELIEWYIGVVKKNCIG